ncbi:MAG TPA: TlpA disulfide reductase family protein [Bacteroidia bacterium]|jgi:thiol-disulfide isomerase/thioredoxin|nr:TlpA disulfide reductase family protein [Bacteroidia bacterium]HRG52039.1 TlpA disulfide reductase family protein [Bacteroidia bacterium]
MKKLNFIIIFIITVINCGIAQNTLPATTVKTVDSKTIGTSTFSNSGKPMIISFWATWCKPCKKELDAIAEHYPDWVKETGVKLIAVSIDDARGFSKVGPEVKTKGWEYEVYIDENQDFKRAMSVNTVPHTFVVDGKGNVVWQHNSYAEGDEDELYEVVKKVAKGEKITE